MSVESDSLLTVHVAACPASVCQRSPLSSKSACHISQVHDSDRPLTHLSCVDLSCVQTLIHVSLYPRLYVFLSAVLLSVPFLHCTVSVTIQAFQLTVDRVFYRRPSACLKCNTCCCPLLVCRSSRCTDCIGLEWATASLASSGKDHWLVRITLRMNKKISKAENYKSKSLSLSTHEAQNTWDEINNNNNNKLFAKLEE